jgi:hypothetical protein
MPNVPPRTQTPADHPNRVPEGSNAGPLVDRSVQHFTDSTGATLLVNSEGRFRLDTMTGKYVRDDG